MKLTDETAEGAVHLKSIDYALPAPQCSREQLLQSRSGLLASKTLILFSKEQYDKMTSHYIQMRDFEYRR